MALAAGEPVGQLAGVIGGGLGAGVIELAAAGARAAARFQPGTLAAQPRGGDRGRDRVDVQGDVEPAGVGDQRLQPARGDFGRVSGDGQGGGVVLANPHVPGGDLHSGRAGHVLGAGHGSKGGAAAQPGGGHASLPGPVTGWPGTASLVAVTAVAGSAQAASKAVT